MPVYRTREGAQTLGSAAAKGTFQHRLAQATSEAPAALLHYRLGASRARAGRSHDDRHFGSRVIVDW
jgi:hypothetical protein